MQLTPRYLVSNKTVLVADLSDNITEYRKLYERNLTVVRGIDNVLLFEIKNADQKPVSILNVYTPKVQIFDEKDVLVISKDGTVKETSTPNYKGQFTLTLTENELLGVKGQYLKYVVFLNKTADGSDTITYADTAFGPSGTIEIISTAFPGPLASYSITTFVQSETDVYYSETISAQPAINGNEALHTAAFYTTNFTGTFTIQATLENQVTGTTQWTDVASLAVSQPSEPKYVNFNGVFSHLRVKYERDENDSTGTVDKILIRN